MLSGERILYLVELYISFTTVYLIKIRGDFCEEMVLKYTFYAMFSSGIR